MCAALPVWCEQCAEELHGWSQVLCPTAPTACLWHMISESCHVQSNVQHAAWQPAASMIPHVKWDEMLLTACSMACVMHRAARHLPGNHSATWHAGLVHSIAVLSEGHRWAHIPCRVGYCQVCAGSQAHALLEGRLPPRAGRSRLQCESTHSSTSSNSCAEYSPPSVCASPHPRVHPSGRR